jgi:hypothetical protein
MVCGAASGSQGLSFHLCGPASSHMSRKRHFSAEPIGLPHSWDFQTWPSLVFPGSAQRAKYLFRMHRGELLAAGACARVGRVIVFFGDGYSRFLRKRAVRVPGYSVAANRGR